jgi:hypothetical protein
MDFLRTGFWMMIYLALTVVLPIAIASHFLSQRKHSAAWSIGIAIDSIVAGAVGFWIALVVTSHLVPPGHELVINANGLVMGLLVGFLVGIPIGTWSGAWGTAALVHRYR